MNKSKQSRKQESVAAVVAEESVKESVKESKKSVKKEEKRVEEAPKVEKVVEPTVEPTVESVPKKVRSKKSSAPAASESVAAPTEDVDAVEETTSSRVKREVTRDTVEAEFNELLVLVKETLDAVSSDRKNPATKPLKSLQKRLKLLRGDCLKISKGKQRAARAQNTTSGFMKPVRISKDMAKFTGWDVEQPRSRVEVTKFICDYIKTNNLQNEQDRRQIQPDSKLCKLLSYDPKKEDKPLTYYYLQKKIQPHFTSLESTVA